MKLKYIGDSFFEGLTDGQFYEGKDVNIYSRLNPGPFAGRSLGRFEIA